MIFLYHILVNINVPWTVSEHNQCFDKYIVHSIFFMIEYTCTRLQIVQTKKSKNDIFTNSFTCIQSEYALHAHSTDKIEIIIF